MQEILVRFLGQEDPLEKGKVTHSSILAWRIPLSMGSKSRTGLRDFHFHFLKHQVLGFPSTSVIPPFVSFIPLLPDL